ncbi:MAG: acetylornithine/succinylornithine family transaminase, partial [Christensenella sp.]
HGAVVKSPEGREYIDFTSGIGVCSVGHGNDTWARAIYDQACSLGHISNLFYTAPSTYLAKRLCEATGMSRVFFANSGAESNEGAIKLARKYSRDRYGVGRDTIITLKQSFHGRTVTTLAATGQDCFHTDFQPFTDGFRHITPNDLSELNGVGTDVAAIMIELVQGEGGVLPLSREYAKAVLKLCRERDILLIVDEVQTGVGRCGKLFAFMEYSLTPDVVTTAKGLAGGLPMGAILAGARCSDVLCAGTHATTFGGNPICAAAAHAVLDILEDGVQNEVNAKGAYIRRMISKMGFETRGLGLMIGVAVAPGMHKKYVAQLVNAGLLCITAGDDTIRFLPPLTITYDEIDRGLSIFKTVMEGVN